MCPLFYRLGLRGIHELIGRASTGMQTKHILLFHSLSVRLTMSQIKQLFTRFYPVSFLFLVNQLYNYLKFYQEFFLNTNKNQLLFQKVYQDPFSDQNHLELQIKFFHQPWYINLKIQRLREKLFRSFLIHNHNQNAYKIH